ncbi:MAG: prepilin-type N-terminal cleavage/methylation domain-containing protein [Vicinamibacterales bacterium]
MTTRLPQPDAQDRGFTLVEVLCALMVLAVALTGVFGVGVDGVSALARARHDSVSASAAAQKMEQLLALTWAEASADTATNLASDPPADGGPGLSPSPSDALDRDVPGWVDYLDADARVVAPGGAATFVRRWSVTPAPFAPGRALVLRVFVTSAATPAPVDRAARARMSGAVLLTTVRVRKDL